MPLVLHCDLLRGRASLHLIITPATPACLRGLPSGHTAYQTDVTSPSVCNRVSAWSSRCLAVLPPLRRSASIRHRPACQPSIAVGRSHPGCPDPRPQRQHGGRHRVAGRRSVSAAAERAVDCGLDAQSAASARRVERLSHRRLPGLPNGDEETGDAWLGLYKSFDGGQRWRARCCPGYPQDTSAARVWRRRSRATRRRRSGGARRHQRADLLQRPGVRSRRERQERDLPRALHRQQQPGSTATRSCISARAGRRRPTGAARFSTSRGWPWTFRAATRRMCGIGGDITDADVERNGARRASRNGAESQVDDAPAGPARSTSRTRRLPATAPRCAPRSMLEALARLRRHLERADARQPAPPMRSTRAPRIAIDPRLAMSSSPVAASPAQRTGARRDDGGPSAGRRQRASTRRARRRCSEPAAVNDLERSFEHAARSVRSRAPARRCRPARSGHDARFSFRTNAYPTMAVDGTGRVYIAWAERGFAAAPQRPSTATRASSSTTTTDGVTFTAPVDGRRPRCSLRATS